MYDNLRNFIVNLSSSQLKKQFLKSRKEKDLKKLENVHIYSFSYRSMPWKN